MEHANFISNDGKQHSKDRSCTPEKQLSDCRLDSTIFCGDPAALWMIGKTFDRSLKTSEPAIRSYRGHASRSYVVLTEVRFRIRRHHNAVSHSSPSRICGSYRLLLRSTADIGDGFSEWLHAGCICVFQPEEDSRHSFLAIASKQPDGVRKQRFAARIMAAFDFLLNE